MFFKKLFCKHQWEIVRRIEKYVSLNGDMLYKRCNKCGKIKEYGFYTTEEQEYLFKRK